MKNIVLLGANGQLGQEIVQSTASDKINIIPLTRKEFNADSDDIDSKLSNHSNIDYIINCIAYHKVDDCEKNVEQSFKINSKFVKELAQYCNKDNCTLIHFSTDYVFDGKSRTAYTESDLPAPLNVYGNSKLSGEMFIKGYAEKYFIFRISSLFGAQGKSSKSINFVEKMIKASNENSELQVIDNQIMSPTHTKDIALMIKDIIEKDCNNYGLYHVSNSGECSWYQFAKKVFDICRLNKEITPVPYDTFHTFAKRPQFCSMDNSKLSSLYKMKNWETALEDYVRIRGYLNR